ncbi:hypothetical protein LOTGIDRAFT_239014 [Lottia gigantea]|uniref:Uncharacterized protein n=1 Tax=Lottia gigantea TaxID=225164 RepID=V4AY83_LOTGI|nr:hypothetical protein LOTGIDRAFT_239014 [Lottia gigantea]ESO98571.1 hypothetical protein LOTGIDRAFT_239014 [Lottia gigantea]
MLISLLYGDSQCLLLNGNCSCRNFVDYIKAECKFEFEGTLDICDENGTLLHLPNKPTMENLAHLLIPRAIYIPVVLETKRVNDKTVKNFSPLLNDWQKKYPVLEKKLKHQVEKGKRPAESPPKSKKDRMRPDGSSPGESPKRASSNRLSRKK